MAWGLCTRTGIGLGGTAMTFTLNIDAVRQKAANRLATPANPANRLIGSAKSSLGGVIDPANAANRLISDGGISQLATLAALYTVRRPRVRLEPSPSSVRSIVVVTLEEMTKRTAPAWSPSAAFYRPRVNWI